MVSIKYMPFSLKYYSFFYSAGGVELLTRQGKIKVDNTLEARLKMVAHNNLPQMRNALFGANQNRKFFD